MDAGTLSSIASVQGSISSLSLQLGAKREEMERLNQASSELLDCQGDFHAKKPLCLKPELTVTTWYGELADNFDTLREDELYGSYVEISDEQLDEAISKLEAKIQEVKQEIQSLEASIAAQRAMLASLYAQGKGAK
ncbi:DUF5082 domain-containing protein [Virgibacillus dakarensis]|uniref:DUF5082 domain-containing protein n=1 Tax=Lentibacillus populi TaxID=1827502 RepID=A0A9W5X6P8_9BACI|nr:MULTISPECIES: DUF5082 family protein [Bacillaceae]MTW86299.1 DUF5082 domain-containing protein [Virgibacillus dakarensis]GGB50003.1 hypothetical protein GCM10011409_29520 [Lentibacillus populi]